MFIVFEWFGLVLWCDAYVLIASSDELSQNQGEGWARLRVGRPQTS